MPRVHNQSQISLRSSYSVTQHDIPSSVKVGAKPSASNVSPRVFNELPTFLHDYVQEPSQDNIKRSHVVKPRRTIKSLDVAPSTVTKQRESVKKYSRIRAQESAPSVFFRSEERRWSASRLRESLSSRSHSKLKDLKDEIKAYNETERLLRLQSNLYKKCGLVMDDLAEDKAVQVEPVEETTHDTGQEIRVNSEKKYSV
uniref:Uncharacterized protein n=1 Tax=Heliothis virescens TaxID=7102 RepID=A0A2A4K020_HELVI